MIKQLTTVLICLSCLLPSMAMAETATTMKHMDVDIGNQAALLRGARTFTNYCLSCHSAKAVRYKQLLPGLRISVKQLKDNLMLPGKKIGDHMIVAMGSEEAKKWFGNPPPDLSDIERAKGADWLYTYLTSFYLDPSRPTGVNNTAFPKVAMPDVLWQLQGLQKPVYKTIKEKDGKTRQVISGLKLVTKGTMTPKQYDATIRDLVDFLAYISAPYQQESHRIGIWVVLLLILFTISAYLLKREYWKDVDH